MQKLIYILVGTMLLAGCDNKDLLQSEKKIKEQLENKNWKRIGAHPDAYYETWLFKDGTLALVKDKNGNGIIDSVDKDIHVNANYSVDTKFSSSYVTLSGIPLDINLYGYEGENMNYKWTIAEINDKVLYLSAANETGTIKSLEFVKQ